MSGNGGEAEGEESSGDTKGDEGPGNYGLHGKDGECTSRADCVREGATNRGFSRA
jgi:hypothetical protein